MDRVKMERWSAEYSQEKDTWDPTDDSHQYLKVTAEDADGEGDMYVALKTDRWALDVNEIDAFADFLKTFLKGVIDAKDK